MSQLYISVIAYDDRDTHNTISSMMENLGDNFNISVVRVGVVLQTDDFWKVASIQSLDYNIDLIHVPRSSARGPCWARSLAQSMWREEEWFFQTDAHMRFQPGWADRLLYESELLNKDKFILTTLPCIVEPKPDMMLITPGHWGDTGLGPEKRIIPQTEKPLVGRLMSGAFLWTKGKSIRDIPYDPHLNHFGEEFSLALRYWTHGYDIYHPCSSVACHFPGNHHFYPWKHDAEWWAKHERAMSYLHKLYGWVENTQNLGIYDLGTTRSIDEWEDWSKITLRAGAGKPEPWKYCEAPSDEEWREML